jgi:hypothetical protein
MSYMDNSMAYLVIFPVASLLFNMSPRVDDVWTSIWCT